MGKGRFLAAVKGVVSMSGQGGFLASIVLRVLREAVSFVHYRRTYCVGLVSKNLRFSFQFTVDKIFVLKTSITRYS